jgi:hypothetical protein
MMLCSWPKMNALEHIIGSRWLANAALAVFILLASAALYMGVGYYTLIGFPPNPFLDWFWPLSCLIVFALSLSAATRLIQRIHGRAIRSALLFSIAAILGGALLLAAILVSLALLRPVK